MHTLKILCQSVALSVILPALELLPLDCVRPAGGVNGRGGATPMQAKWIKLDVIGYRVRLYDTRLPGFSPVHTFMGHHGAVECIQCDDKKIVSGDNEGYVCVWDQRTTSKLWESKNT